MTIKLGSENNIITFLYIISCFLNQKTLIHFSSYINCINWLKMAWKINCFTFLLSISLMKVIKWWWSIDWSCLQLLLWNFQLNLCIGYSCGLLGSLRLNLIDNPFLLGSLRLNVIDSPCLLGYLRFRVISNHWLLWFLWMRDISDHWFFGFLWL